MLRPPLVLAAIVVTLALGAARAPAASLDPSLWRGDARFLVSAVDSLHPKPYRWARRAAWDSAAAALERRLPILRYDQAVAGFSELLGLLRDGHSRLDQVELAAHGRPTLTPLPGPGFGVSFPIECEVFADGLWVIGATAAHADLLGAHVVAIDGRPVAAAVAALAPLVPADNPLWSLYVLPAVLRCPGYLAAAGLARDPGQPLELDCVDHAGRKRTASIAAIAPEPAPRWLAADAATTVPLPLTRRLPGPFAYADLGDTARTVFVRIRQIVDTPGGERMGQFVARLFAHVDSLGARRLILDVRGNGGGNNYLNQPLVHALIRRPQLDRRGALFVVIDRGTFSAAVSLASDLQRETHAVFVGEPTGGAPNSPGDPASVTLPASGLVVRISTVFWQGSDPRDPRGFIAPDLPAMPTAADWLAHRDPALAAIGAFADTASAADVPPNHHWASPAQLGARVPAIVW